jgi:hypothetical protein
VGGGGGEAGEVRGGGGGGGGAKFSMGIRNFNLRTSEVKKWGKTGFIFFFCI